MSESGSAMSVLQSAGTPAAAAGIAQQAFVRVFNDFGQQSADVAVIIPSIWRPSLQQAIQSVLRQDYPGRIQIMLGFDTPNTAHLDLEEIVGELPANRSVYAFYPGYSTSRRHGGVHAGFDGGALRVLLCYLANARRVAFLDDDNWWAEDHISSLVAIMDSNVQWAFTLRWFVDPRSDCVLCVDEWESVGPDRGVYVSNFGGFVDPNCLMYDKIACDPATRFWAIPMAQDATQLSTDRQVFNQLRSQFTWRGVDRPTVYYRMNLTDPVQKDRLRTMQARGIQVAP